MPKWSFVVSFGTVVLGAGVSKVDVAGDRVLSYSLLAGGMVYKAEQCDRRRTCTSSICASFLRLERICAVVELCEMPWNTCCGVEVGLAI